MQFINKLDKENILYLMNVIKETEQKKGNFYLSVEPAEDYCILAPVNDGQKLALRALGGLSDHPAPVGVFYFTDFTLDIGEPSEEYNALLRDMLTNLFADEYKVALDDFLKRAGEDATIGSR